MPKKKTKKRKSWMKWIFILVVLIVIGLLYIPTMDKKEKEPFVTEEPEPEEEPELTTGAEYGDLVKINFVLSLKDGTVVDTNNESLAKKYNLENYVKGPFAFILGNSDKIYGKAGKVKPFDEAIKGLEVGDKRTIDIQPTEQVLALQIDINESKQRRIPVPTVNRFSKQRFKDIFNKSALEGDVVANYEKFPWSYQILNVTKKSVYAKIMLKPGDEVVLPGTEWKSQALDVGTKLITFVQNPEIGQIISTPYGTAEITNVTLGKIWMTHNPELGKVFNQRMSEEGQAGMMYDFVVHEINEENFVIRRTNYLQQEHLELKAEVLDIIEDVKDVS